MDHETVFKILERRLETARRQNREAALKFNAVIGERASALPHPDGVARIRNVGRNYRRTMQDLTAAQDQMTAFLLHGTVPKDIELGYLN